MNFQSGKLCAPTLGKLVAFSHKHVRSQRIGKALNLERHKLSELKIKKVATFEIRNFQLRASSLSRRQAGNWLRSELSALKIETVENGSIRQ